MSTTTADSIIHEHMPGLEGWNRDKVEGYLMEVAEALMESWGNDLADFAEKGRSLRISPRGNTKAQNRFNQLLEDFKATESLEGIMKNAVLINHQWVLKLGYSAVQEMDCYDDACGEFLEQLVPSVWLDTQHNLGLLQLKVELPDQNSNYLFVDPEIEKNYIAFLAECGIGDLHRSNVGIWQDQLVAIDFEGG